MRSTVLMLVLGGLLSGCGGGSNATLEGCATGPRTQGRQTRGGQTRGGPAAPPVGSSTSWARREGDRVIVDGTIEHACCLEGEANAELDDEGVFLVRVQLSGEPCRCMCSTRVTARSDSVDSSPRTVRLLLEGSGSAPERHEFILP